MCNTAFTSRLLDSNRRRLHWGQYEPLRKLTVLVGGIILAIEQLADESRQASARLAQRSPHPREPKEQHEACSFRQQSVHESAEAEEAHKNECGQYGTRLGQPRPWKKSSDK